MYSLFNFRDAAEESEDSTDSSASFVQVQSLGLDNFEKGKEENKPAAQAALSHRALMNKLAARGEWSESLEK